VIHCTRRAGASQNRYRANFGGIAEILMVPILGCHNNAPDSYLRTLLVVNMISSTLVSCAL
jgi:hypothetical protein